ncbi:MAG: 2-C-methyl-D-erythritol 4-phosphate cytidylyltransferase [Bacteroidales bacterium]|nr:2-C-methyl-D-erythritol 4-phosphate cytidylyltransferase [Bacteroidales bacterium]
MDTVIIVAGGSGKRFKSDIPKQFLELSGKPVLMRTIEVFFRYKSSLQIILVLPKQHIEFWKDLCEKYEFNIRHKIVQGGKTRFHSVKNALNTVDRLDNLVAIHDGVRPLVSQETINRCFFKAKESGNAIPCIPPHDSVRQISENTNHIIDRSLLRLIQTPQVFHTNILKQAYNQEYKEVFTDDASVLESLGEKIFLVEGNRENIKITNNIDLIIAEALFKP